MLPMDEVALMKMTEQQFADFIGELIVEEAEAGEMESYTGMLAGVEVDVFTYREVGVLTLDKGIQVSINGATYYITVKRGN